MCPVCLLQIPLDALGAGEEGIDAGACVGVADADAGVDAGVDAAEVAAGAAVGAGAGVEGLEAEGVFLSTVFTASGTSASSAGVFPLVSRISLSAPNDNRS